MKLTHLSWQRYRNLVDASLEPHPQLNLFVGGNGQGKTNLLSALYWLATLRPLQTQRLRELPRWGERETQVEGHVERDELIHRLEVSLEWGKRVSRRENKQVSARDYFG
ncbi:MAG: DNA replication and repair protein RecF, partial [Myxococcota bacterium]|nr:DNA replication and repair protein RecF [Myxococcota bacterium]